MTRSDDFFTYGMVEVSGVPGMYSACTTDVKNVALIKNVARSWENGKRGKMKHEFYQSREPLGFKLPV